MTFLLLKFISKLFASMSWVLVIILLIIPSIEIWILVNLSDYVSLITVFLECLVTFAAGLWFIQTESFSILTLVKSELINKRIPSEEKFADLLMWSGGALLIVPGVITDGIGLIIFIPLVRDEFISFIKKYIKKSIKLKS